MSKALVTVLIATRNRIEDLKVTLDRSMFLLNDERVKFIVCDDNSSDGTYDFLEKNYPKIQLLQNETNKGILYCRNLMFSKVTTKYAITIDDDINFVNEFDIETLVSYFKEHSRCAIMAFRIFWGLELPDNLISNEPIVKVKSFGAGGHAIRMSDFNSISRLPEWFEFYGEEDFMAIQLFKQGKEIHYTPDVFVHHRVDLNKRKKEKDYYKRLYLSIRSGCYIYLMFYPKSKALKSVVYSFYVKIKDKVLMGDFKVLWLLIKVIASILYNSKKLLKNSLRLSNKEYNTYRKLPQEKLFWKP